MSTAANPRHPNNPPSDPPSEPTGMIAADSLARESIDAGGVFSENPNPELTSAKGYQSTLANEDTTNADVLKPATSRETRDSQAPQKYPDPGASEGFTGTHSPEGYVGGTSSGAVGSLGAAVSSAPTTTTTEGAGAGARPYIEKAPGYTADLTEEGGDLKPKGADLVEGGGIPKDHVTYVGDVDSMSDPSRVAQRTMQTTMADSSGGSGARDYSGGGDNPYTELESSERA